MTNENAVSEKTIKLLSELAFFRRRSYQSVYTNYQLIVISTNFPYVINGHLSK